MTFNTDYLMRRKKNFWHNSKGLENINKSMWVSSVFTCSSSNNLVHECLHFYIILLQIELINSNVNILNWSLLPLTATCDTCLLLLISKVMKVNIYKYTNNYFQFCNNWINFLIFHFILLSVADGIHWLLKIEIK